MSTLQQDSGSRMSELKAPFPYFGGKRRAAPLIWRALGDPWGGGPWRVVDGHLINTTGTRGGESTGVNRKLPHLGDAGRGIHRALPHLGNAGRGIHRASPHLGDAGRDHLDALAAYMRTLADRLARVRIACGDWTRVLKPSVTRSASGGDGSVGILLDPPYATSGDLYAHSEDGISGQVRAWCLTAPRDYRIVLCGYDDEHEALAAHGWNVIEGKSGGGAGYSTNAANGRRERLWLSPACPDPHGTQGVFAFTSLTEEIT